MTVTTDINRTGPLPADGIITTFNSTFKVYAASDIKVIHADALGAQTELTYVASAPAAGQFSVTGVGSATFVVTTGSTYVSGETITLLRDMTLDQQRAFSNQSGYRGETHELTYDELTMMVQQLQEELDRSIKVTESTVLSAQTVQPVAERYLRWNATADALESFAIPSGTVAISSFWELGLVEPNLADSLAAMSVTPEDFRSTIEVDRPVQTKTGSYTMVATDVNNVIQWTSAGTFSLLAAGVAGSDFYVDIFANGGAVTIDPDGSETVNGSATLLVADTESATLVCTGTGWLLLKGGAGGGNWKGGTAEKGAANNADIFRVHAQQLDNDTTLDADENASCTGPLTVASGVTLTLSSGNRLVIV